MSDKASSRQAFSIGRLFSSLGRRRNRVVAAASAPTIESLESRLFLNAALDTTFNGNGVVTGSIRATTDAISGATQSDGKLVIVGDTAAAGGKKVAFIERLNADGSLDTTFSGTGVVIVPNLSTSVDALATGVVIEPDNNDIVICGTTGALSSLKADAFIARFNPNGSLDSSFGGQGVISFDYSSVGGLPNGAAATAIAVGNSIVGTPRFVVGGASLTIQGAAMAGAYFNFDGSPNADIGGSKFVSAEATPGTLETGTAIATRGSFTYMAGTAFNLATGQATFIVRKFNPDGSDAIHFGTNGAVTVDFGRQVAIATAIHLTPAVTGDPNFTVKLTVAGGAANGILNDTSPGIPTSLGSSSASVGDIAVARILDGTNAAGVLDTTFNGTGTELIHSSTAGVSDLSGATGLVVQNDGKIVLGGGSEVRSSGQSNFVLARLGPNGGLDSTFGDNGIITQDLGESDGAFAMIPDLGANVDPTGIISYALYEMGHTKTSIAAGAEAILKYTVDDQGSNSNPTSANFASGAPALTVSNATVVEGNTGTTNEIFTVTLSNPPATAVTVDYTTAAGTADLSDYAATSGTLLFNAGTTVQQIAVPVIGDTTPEADETFTFNLSNATGGATIATAQGVGTIIDDDGSVATPPNPLLGGGGPGPGGVATLETTAVTVSAPATIVGGQKTAKGTVTVVVTNDGGAKLSGNETVTIFGSADDTIDASDISLGHLKKKLSLKVGQSTTVKVPVTFPAVGADGDIHILSRTIGTGVAAAAGSTGEAAATVHVVQPVITLNGLAAPQAPKAVKFGKTTNLSIPLTNVGNVEAKGKVVFTLLATTDGTVNTLIRSTTASASIDIKPNATKVSKLVLGKIPAGAVPAGNYIVLVQITSTTTNPTNSTNGGTVATIPVVLA